MSILSGHKKYERYLKTNNGYQLCSMKTYADSVHFSDGTTVQNNLGGIKGITDSLTATSSNVALSAAAGNNLQTQVSELNSNLTWKLLGHLTGGGTETKNKLIPPQGYRELLIVSSCTGVNTMTIHVPAGASGWFSGSYYITGTDNAFFRVGVQETAIWLGISYQNSGTNVTDATQLDVYYK